VRTVAVTGFAVLMLALPAAAAETSPSPAWLLQAHCVHLREGPWTANTGNGYYGGMQFPAQTWKRRGGKPDPAKVAAFFAAHPETAAFRAWAKTAKPSASFATESYWSLNAFVFVDAIPRTSAGKFKKTELRDMYRTFFAT